MLNSCAGVCALVRVHARLRFRVRMHMCQCACVCACEARMHSCARDCPSVQTFEFFGFCTRHAFTIQERHFTELHSLLNRGQFGYALEMLTNTPEASMPLVLAPTDCRFGAGNSALHFLAYAGGNKSADLDLLAELATLLCEACRPILDVRNERGLMALHVAASAGNDMMVRALLHAGAGGFFLCSLELPGKQRRPPNKAQLSIEAPSW